MAARALEGVRVIDLTRTTAGLFGGTILGELGADVILIEPREVSPHTISRFASLTYSKDGVDMRIIQTYRNHKSLTLEIKKPEGREVLYDLVRVSDVVMDNYRAGVMKGLGLDYETLSEINPRVICASITGFGAEGPYARRPGYDPVVQAMSGLLALCGNEGQPFLYPGIPIADLGTGMFAVQGVLAALYQRQRTGRGQKVEACLLDTSLAFLHLNGAYFLNTGKVPQRSGSKSRSEPLMGIFRTQDSYIVPCAHSEKQVRNLCHALGHDEWLEDPRFKSRENRARNREELNRLVEEAFLTRNTAQWEEIIMAADVPVSRVNRLDQVFADPHVASRGMTPSFNYEGTEFRALGCPIQLSESPPRYDPPPTWGQDTQEVLSAILGYTSERIESLRQRKLV